MSHFASIYEHSEAKFLFYSQNVSAPHFHSHAELKFVLDGDIEATLGGESFILKPGMGIIVFPYQRHAYRNIDNRKVCLIQLPYDAGSAYSEIFARKRPLSPVFRDADGGMTKMLGELCVYNKETPSGALKTVTMNGFASGIFGMVLSETELVDASASENGQTADRIIDYCAMHFTEPLSIESVAAELFISSRQISRILSGRFNVSFRGFINSLRVQQAIKLLSLTTMNVSEIAYECGFESLCTFNRVFRSLTGQTPTVARRSGRSLPR